MIDLQNIDAVDYLESLEPNSIDAIVTDPPYSSGGFIRGDRTASTSSKYVQSGTIKTYAEFAGDNRDSRSYLAWCDLWLRRCYRAAKPSAYCMVFCDWRQLPTISDAIQSAGFVWRGIVAWDKTASARAPHKGYFRHQCEYVVWGTKGACRKATHDGPYPGCITQRIDHRKKLHMTAKPVELIEQLCRVVPAGGSILDPFAGSATTAIAADNLGHKFYGCELDTTQHQIATDRINRHREANSTDVAAPASVERETLEDSPACQPNR